MMSNKNQKNKNYIRTGFCFLIAITIGIMGLIVWWGISIETALAGGLISSFEHDIRAQACIVAGVLFVGFLIIEILWWISFELELGDLNSNQAAVRNSLESKPLMSMK